MTGLKDRRRGSGEILPHWHGRCGLVRSCPAILPHITKPGAPFLEATVRYFSFFTFLTNILVALALTLPWISLALIGIDRRMGRSNEQAAGVAT